MRVEHAGQEHLAAAMATLNFSQRNALSTFLVDRPPEWALALGIRAVLRVVPIALAHAERSAVQMAFALRLVRDLNGLILDVAWPRTPKKWTPLEIRDLTYLWGKGFTANAIGRTIGSYSRHAVKGKARRLGLADAYNTTASFLITSEFEKETLTRLQTVAEKKIYNALMLLIRFRTMMNTASFPIGLSVLERAIRLTDEACLEYVDIGNITSEEKRARSVISQVERDAAFLQKGVSPKRLLVRSALWFPGAFPLHPSLGEAESRFASSWLFDRFNGDSKRTENEIRARMEAVRDLPLEIWAGGPVAVTEALSGPNIEAANDTGASDRSVIDLEQVEEQNRFAVIFHESADGRVDLDETPSLDLDISSDARDRHAEVLDAIEEIETLASATAMGSNSVSLLMKQISKLREALGKSVTEVRAGLLIPRGERLRILLRQQLERDEFAEYPPLPSVYVGNLEVLVSSFNIYVALDQKLSNCDEARLSPDDSKMVNVNDLRLLVDSAVSSRVATSRAKDIVDELSETFDESLDFSVRSNRRFFESCRNFFRAAVRIAAKTAKFAWNNKVVGGSAVAGGYSSVIWISRNAEYLVTFFPTNSSMVEVIRQVAAVGKHFI